MPSPEVGSGVEVRQTIESKASNLASFTGSDGLTLNIMESEHPQAIVLCSVTSDSEVQGDAGPATRGPAVSWWTTDLSIVAIIALHIRSRTHNRQSRG